MKWRSLRYLVDGFSYKMIAEKCAVSYATVNTHVSHIYQKLQVKSVAGAVSLAVQEEVGVKDRRCSLCDLRTMAPLDFLSSARKEFAYYRSLGEKTFAQLPDADLFRDRAGNNSIAVIVKHLHGNMLSRWTDFLTTDSESLGGNVMRNSRTT